MGDYMVPTTFQGNQEAPLICLAIYPQDFSGAKLPMDATQPN